MVLLFAGASLALCLIVLVLAVIKEAANGRYRVRSDFDEVEIPLARGVQRLGERQNAQALPVLTNDEDFVGANALVPANLAGYARVLASNRCVVIPPGPNYSESSATASTGLS